MARGKHAQASANRRAGDAAALIASLRSDLAVAKHRAAHAAALSTELEVVKAELTRQRHMNRQGTSDQVEELGEKLIAQAACHRADLAEMCAIWRASRDQAIDGEDRLSPAQIATLQRILGGDLLGTFLIDGEPNRNQRRSLKAGPRTIEKHLRRAVALRREAAP